MWFGVAAVVRYAEGLVFPLLLGTGSRDEDSRVLSGPFSSGRESRGSGKLPAEAPTVGSGCSDQRVRGRKLAAKRFSCNRRSLREKDPCSSFFHPSSD